MQEIDKKSSSSEGQNQTEEEPSLLPSSSASSKEEVQLESDTSDNSKPKDILEVEEEETQVIGPTSPAPAPELISTSNFNGQKEEDAVEEPESPIGQTTTTSLTEEEEKQNEGTDQKDEKTKDDHPEPEPVQSDGKEDELNSNLPKELQPETPQEDTELNEPDIEDFPGFTLDDQCELIPIVEKGSLGLFEIVQRAENEYLRCITNTFLKSEFPVQIPSYLFQENRPDGLFDPKIVIEQIRIGKGKDTHIYFTGIHKTRPNLKKNFEPFLDDADDEDDGVLTIDEEAMEMNSSVSEIALAYLKPQWKKSELDMLRKPLNIGWTREVVLRNLDGSGSSQVTYKSPAGYIVRSYKDVATVLGKSSNNMLVKDNFSFSPSPIGSPYEYVKISPQWLKWIEMNPDRVGGNEVVRVVKRGYLNYENRFKNMGSSQVHQVPQKRGRMDTFGSSLTKKLRSMKSELGKRGGGDGGLFGISALSELFAGIEEADAARELEDYNHMMNLMAAQENMFEALDPMNSVDSLLDEGDKSGRAQILPCSIRCPGMTGDIPTLQCTRCLCLYHPQCLGYPADMDTTNFLCSNCDGNASSDDLEEPKKESILDLMEKLMDLRKGRPANKSVGFQQLGKSGVSLKRLDTNRSLPIPFSRSLKLQPFGKTVPRIPIPQLTTRNVTITPLPLPLKGQLPRVPTLNPINVPKLSSQRPPNQRPSSGVGGLDFLKTNSLRQLGKSPFPLSNNDSQKRAHQLPPNFGASFGPSKPINPEVFRKFPQSVVTVNSKKFIVVQNPGLANKNKDSRFGENSEVLGLVFKYLTVKDLLNASRVNNCWNKTASSSSLWKVVRLKNSRIYDIESFVEFIRARETESIDFRKLLGSVEWNELFSRLSDVESLNTIILGSRSGQVFELAQEHCPHVEVTTGP